MRFKRISSLSGFTLIELIAVMILVGILAVFVAPRLNTSIYDARTVIDEAQSTLRYAQKIAVAQHRPVFVVFGGNGGALCFDGACAAHVPTPTGAPAVINLPSGVTAGINRAIPGFYFNALGKPFDSGNVEPVSTFARTIVTISGGGMSRAITIEPETGYVH
jgi:MSHA pilin protein MshC